MIKRSQLSMANSESPEYNVVATEAGAQTPFMLRFTFSLFSYVFHPLFIPAYTTLFLLYIHPSYFTGYDTFNKSWLPIRVLYGSVFLPAFTVFLLKQLKFIDSVFLKTQKDRIIPYVACGIYFFWLYLVCRNDSNLPTIMTSFMLGVFLAASAALIANIYFKISMHAIGMGGILGLFLLIMQQNTMLMTWPLCLAFLTAGIVCTSRMIVSDHRPKEVYTGLILGIVSQFIGAVIQL